MFPKKSELSARERLRAFFFGRDVFISYCYVDSAYAEALAVALQKRKLSVFLGAWGATPGPEISEAVSNAARQSRLLVVIATPHSRESIPVGKEIAYFAHRKRSVIPVDIGLGIHRTEVDWPALSGTDVVYESPDLDPKQPVPSDAVLTRIMNAATFTRQTTRLAQFIATVFIAAAVLIGAAVGAATLWSRAVVGKAEAKANAAEQQALEARARAIHADVRMSAAQLRTESARFEMVSAKFEMRMAMARTARAESDRRIAAAEAERERAIGSAMRTANDAAALLDMQPARVAGAALMAAESAGFLDKRGTGAPAAHDILRETLRLLPLVLDRTSFRIDRGHAPVTADGRWIVDRCGDSFDVVNSDSGERRQFSVPHDYVLDLAVSAAGDTVAVVYAKPGELGDPDRIRLAVWSASTGHAQTFSVPQGFVNALAVTDAADFVAFTTSNGTFVLRVADGAVVAETPVNDPRTLTFSRGGDVLAATGASSFAWSWRTDRKPVPLPRSHRVVFHPLYDDLIATIGEQAMTIRRWRDDAVLWSTLDGRLINDVTFSADGNQIAYLGLERAYVVNWQQPREVTTFDLRGYAERIVPTQWGAVIAYGDGSIDALRTWGVSPIAGRIVHNAPVLAVALRADGAIRSVSAAGMMTSWPNYWSNYTFGTHENGLAAVSPGGTMVVTSSPRTAEPAPKVVELVEYRDQFVSARMSAGWTALAAGPGDVVYSGDKDGRVLRWNSVYDTWNPNRPPSLAGQAPGPVSAIAVDRTGHLAWASGNEVWVAGTSTPLRAPSPVTVLAFGNSKAQLAAGMSDGTIVLWRNGVPSTFIRKGAIASTDVSTDGRFLAAAGGGEPATIWPVERPDLRFSLPGEPATAIAFHPSDGTIAAGGRDGIVHVWSDWRTSRVVEIARYRGGANLGAVRFSEDGRYVITVPQFGTGIRELWKTRELIAAVCRRSEPLLDTSDRRRYDAVCARPAVRRAAFNE